MEQRDDLTLMRLALTAMRNKKCLLGMPILVALLAGGLSFLISPSYTAVTRILPPQSNSSQLAQLLGNAAIPGGISNAVLGIRNPIEMYVSLLRSRTIADRLVERFELKKLLNEELDSEVRKILSVRTGISWARDGIIVIEVDDPDPKRAAQLANAYVEELAWLQQQLQLTDASSRRAFFERQLQATRSLLSDSEVQLKNLQAKTGLIALEEQGRVTIEAMARMQAEITQREVQLQAVRSFATNANPAVQRLTDEIGALRQQLAKLERSGGATSGILIQSSKAPELGLEYVRAFRAVRYYEAVFETLSKQYELAKLEEARDAIPVQVIDVAIPPDRRSWPKRRLIVIAAFLTAFLVACGALYWRNIFKPEWNRRRRLAHNGSP